MSVTSIITGVTNGAAAPIATNDKAAKAAATKAANVAAKAAKAAKAAALLSTAIPEMVAPVVPTILPATAPKVAPTTVGIPDMIVPPVVLTPEQAIAIAYDYGASMAGLDGVYTNALKQFKADESVLASMTVALNLGFLVRKLGIAKVEAERIFALKKHNPDTVPDDGHRTFEQQRIMDSVRVMIHRANKLAGIDKPKSEAQVTAELNRAKVEAEKAEHESRLIAADAIIHPAKEVDINTAMVRYVAAMRNYHNGHANLFVGDSGMAWRDWLQAAPIPR